MGANDNPGARSGISITVRQIVSQLGQPIQRIQRPIARKMKDGSEIFFYVYRVLKCHFGYHEARYRPKESYFHLCGFLLLRVIKTTRLKVIRISEATQRPVMVEKGARAVYEKGVGFVHLLPMLSESQ